MSHCRSVAVVSFLQVSIPKGAIMRISRSHPPTPACRVSIPKGAIMSAFDTSSTSPKICFNSKRCDYEIAH